MLLNFEDVTHLDEVTVPNKPFFVIAAGISTVLAGGSSDSSGEGFHCYLFFTLPDGKFAQAMVNDSDPDEVIKKVEELIEKYAGDEEGTLDLSVGNIEDTLCGTDDDLDHPSLHGML